MLESINQRMTMERHISKPLPPGWDILYAKYLSDHTAVGQNTARKYAAVMKQAAKKGVLDSEKLAKFSKEKNRFYVRAAIVSFIDFLEYNRLLDDGEAKDVLMGIPRVREKDAKPRELLTIEEVQNVMGRLEKEERLAAQFLFFTGARISEAMAVRLADVNFQTGFVNVTGKGGKPRPVMLPPAYLKDLKKYLDEMGVLKLEGVFYPFSKSEPAVKSMMFNEKFRKACIGAVGR